MCLISTCECLPEFITHNSQILVHALLHRSLYLHESELQCNFGMFRHLLLIIKIEIERCFQESLTTFIGVTYS